MAEWSKLDQKQIQSMLADGTSINAAAKMLGVSHHVLTQAIRRYDIEIPPVSVRASKALRSAPGEYRVGSARAVAATK